VGIIGNNRIIGIIGTAIFIDITFEKTHDQDLPRIARIVAAGYSHHITQRGNYRQKIFADATDRRKYLSLLKEESKRYHLDILAYCLMSNHVHFMVIPQREDSLGKVFKYTKRLGSLSFYKKCYH